MFFTYLKLFLIFVFFEYIKPIQRTQLSRFEYLKGRKCYSIKHALNFLHPKDSKFIYDYERNLENYNKINLKYYGQKSKYIKNETHYLGNGTFGFVYKGMTINNETIAIKEINNFKWERNYLEIYLLLYLNPIKDIGHLKDVYKEENRTTLVLEFVNGTSLTKSSRNIKTEDEVRIFSYRFLKALADLHDFGVIHNDLKGANVLLDLNTTTLKLIDFGISYMYEPFKIKSQIGGTINYKAPEQLLNIGYSSHFTPAIDVFAAGVLIAHMMYKTQLFMDQTETDILIKQLEFFGTEKHQKLSALMLQNMNAETYQRILNLKRSGYYDKKFISKRSHLSKDGVDLLKQLLEVYPFERISARDVLKHKYFDPIRHLVE